MQNRGLVSCRGLVYPATVWFPRRPLTEPANVSCLREAVGELRPLYEKLVGNMNEDPAAERERVNPRYRLDIDDRNVLDPEQADL